jgi:hypothetical protein
MKKILLLTVFFMAVGLTTFAQNNSQSYQQALGVKFYPGAITYKSFSTNTKAFEGIAYLSTDGFRATGLLEFYGNINNAPGLRWYAGPGAHIGFWSNDWRDRYPNRNDGVAIGLDAIVGLDYKFNGAPINMSIDWQPSFNLIGYNYFEGGWGGISIRYVIK